MHTAHRSPPNGQLTDFPFLRLAVSKKQHIQTIKFNRCCDRLITFDLTELVQKWKLYADSNHGILLELTDDLGNKLNVEDYIQTMNCSGRSCVQGSPCSTARALYLERPNGAPYLSPRRPASID